MLLFPCYHHNTWSALFLFLILFYYRLQVIMNFYFHSSTMTNTIPLCSKWTVFLYPTLEGIKRLIVAFRTFLEVHPTESQYKYNIIMSTTTTTNLLPLLIKRTNKMKPTLMLVQTLLFGLIFNCTITKLLFDATLLKIWHNTKETETEINGRLSGEEKEPMDKEENTTAELRTTATRRVNRWSSLTVSVQLIRNFKTNNNYYNTNKNRNVVVRTIVSTTPTSSSTAKATMTTTATMVTTKPNILNCDEY